MENRLKFLSDLSKIVKNNGLVILTTLNKSIASNIFGKFLAENFLKIIPQGSHDIEKFVAPETLVKKENLISILMICIAPTFTISVFSKEKYMF